MAAMSLPIPDGYVPIFDFENSTSKSIRLVLELVPQEVELKPGDKVQVFIYGKDANLPLTMELTEDCLQIHPHKSWGNWYVFKNGKDVSTLYREPYTRPFLGLEQ
jgi:hypothetical protein